MESRRYGTSKLLPLYAPEKCIELPINLAPNGVFPRGRVLGQIAATANEVQTLTVTGTPTSGNLLASLVNPNTGDTVTFTLPFNATAVVAQAAARAALGGSHVTVTGGALPGAALVFTFGGGLAAMPIAPMTLDLTGLAGGTPGGTVAQTTTGRTANTFTSYADANTDGSEVARCILSYDCATGPDGMVTFGTVAGTSARGDVYPDAPAYFIGLFATTDLSGLDAAGVADLGRLLSGTVANGVLSMC
jgi:hypothetical protein